MPLTCKELLEVKENGKTLDGPGNPNLSRKRARPRGCMNRAIGTFICSYLLIFLFFQSLAEIKNNVLYHATLKA